MRKDVPTPDSEEYKKYGRLYISFFREAVRRRRFRHFQAQARAAKYRAEKLANAVRAMDCLYKAVDKPKIREKLLYRVNPLYFARQFNQRMPYLIIVDHRARALLIEYILNPAKMMKKGTIKKICTHFIVGSQHTWHKRIGWAIAGRDYAMPSKNIKWSRNEDVKLSLQK